MKTNQATRGGPVETCTCDNQGGSWSRTIYRCWL